MRKWEDLRSEEQRNYRKKFKALHKESYQEYLQSSEWEKKRQAVMKRDGHICRICENRATHVHHLTYDRKYNEPLYDLVAICQECHSFVHRND